MNPPSLDLDAALGTLADRLETPSWANMVEQAGETPTLHRTQRGDASDRTASKHERGGGWAPRGKGPRGGRGTDKRGRGQRGQGSSGRGRQSTSQPKTLTQALSDATETEGRDPPSVSTELEGDLDQLSQASSVHSKQIEHLQEELDQAKGIIAGHHKDMQAIMSEMSSIRREMRELKGERGHKDITQLVKESSVKSPSPRHQGTEIVKAKPKPQEESVGGMVATGPSWKRQLNI